MNTEKFLSFNDFDGFIEEIQNIEKTDVWQETTEEEIHLVTYKGQPIENGITPNYGELTLEAEGKFYALHDIAFKTLLDRAGVKSILSADILKSKKCELLEELTNMGLSYYGKKKCNILHRDDLIMAVHGVQYSVMPQSEGFLLADEVIRDRFPKAEFVEGAFCYEYSYAKYKLCDSSNELFDEYRKAWSYTGLNTGLLDNSTAYLVVKTSDVGEYCFTLKPYFSIGKMEIPIGEELTVKHTGKNEVELIRKKAEEAFAECSKILKDQLPLMMKTELQYPQPALVRILRQSKICGSAGTKKFAENIIETFESLYDTYSTVIVNGIEMPSPDRDVLTAFDLFRFIAERQKDNEFLKLAESSKIKTLEKISRIPGMNWTALDKDGDRYL